MQANVIKNEARTSADAIKLMTKICKMVDKMKPNALIYCINVAYDASRDSGGLSTSNLLDDLCVGFTVFYYDETKERGYHNTGVRIYSWESAEKAERKMEFIRNILVATSAEKMCSLAAEADAAYR